MAQYDVPDFRRIQYATFLNWCNVHLAGRAPRLTDIGKSFQDGTALLLLLEKLSGQRLDIRTPTSPQEEAENIAQALQFIRLQNIKLIDSAGPPTVEDIHRGNRDKIAGLIWSLVVHYDIRHGNVVGSLSPQDILLDWVSSQLPDREIHNFTTDWTDGRLLFTLVRAFEPGSLASSTDNMQMDSLTLAQMAIDCAFDRLGVPRVLAPEDLVSGKTDNLSLMTYLALFRNSVMSQADLGFPAAPRQSSPIPVSHGDDFNAPLRYQPADNVDPADRPTREQSGYLDEVFEAQSRPQAPPVRTHGYEDPEDVRRRARQSGTRNSGAAMPPPPVQVSVVTEERRSGVDTRGAAPPRRVSPSQAAAQPQAPAVNPYETIEDEPIPVDIRPGARRAQYYDEYERPAANYTETRRVHRSGVGYNEAFGGAYGGARQAPVRPQYNPPPRQRPDFFNEGRDDMFAGRGAAYGRKERSGYRQQYQQQQYQRGGPMPLQRRMPQNQGQQYQGQQYQQQYQNQAYGGGGMVARRGAAPYIEYRLTGLQITLPGWEGQQWDAPLIGSSTMRSFPVNVEDSRAARKYGIVGPAWLQINLDFITLIDRESGGIIVQWPLNHVQKFGKDIDLFSLEIGHIGECFGVYYFHTEQSDDAFAVLSRYIQAW